MGFLYSHFLLVFSSISFISSLHVLSMHPYVANNYQGPSDLVYHMGPVLAAPINLFIIWYGDWNVAHQAIIRDFLLSLSSTSTPSPPPFPSVADWWRTVQLYTDQTGTNVTAHFILSGENYDSYSHGRYLTRLAIQSIIKTAVSKSSRPLPLDPYNGLYLVLTSHDVQVQDFCRAVCGFHYFTFPLIVGATVPYAWIGHSGTQCPGMCAYPFAWARDGPPTKVLVPPNGDIGTDGMVSVIAHELAEMATNPLINAWYAGDDPSAPMEIADLCVGMFGSGAGGGFVGQVYKGPHGSSYNLHGVKGRKFMVQWVWNPVRNRCFGPNSLD